MPDPQPKSTIPAPGVPPAGATDATAGLTAPAPSFFSPESEPLPTAVGPYRVLGLLGRGGMGVVYRAIDPGLRREVALKVLLPDYTILPQARARFVREARAQAKVEHDHVASIYHVAEHAGQPYLVMALLKGMPLHSALRANPHPPLREVVRIGREMAEGLAAAHAVGLVHRDVKPSNVWLEGRRLRVKVLDFGLARAAGGPEATPAGAAPPESGYGSLTRTGAVMGTPAYMSPEQARGETLDHRTDLFSLGIVLYQMATGRLPFSGATPTAVLFAVQENTPTPPRELIPELPPELGALIVRLLSKDPSGRPDSAEAAALELRQIELALLASMRLVPLDTISAPAAGLDPDPFAELDPTESDTPSQPFRVPAGPARSGWVWAWVGLAVLVAAAAVAWAAGLFSAKKPAPSPEPEPQKPVAVPLPMSGPEPKAPTLPAGSDPTFFNGKDLTGWGKPAREWSVRDGAIVCSMPQFTKSSPVLATDRLFGDFEVSFRLSRPLLADSQVTFAFRRPPVAGPDTPGLALYGDYAAVIKGNERARLRPGAFNDVTVRCVGKWVTVVVNGTTLLDEELDVAAEGRFSFQCHGMKGEVVIKDIRFTDLSPPHDPTFFNGKDLTGWTMGRAGVWKVADGAIVGEGPIAAGLRSTRAFTDFELSFAVQFTNIRRGRFEVFFRQTGRRDRRETTARIHFEPDVITFPKNPGGGRAALDLDSFNTVAIRCVGSRVTVTANGTPIADQEFDIPPEGWFAFEGGGPGQGVTIKDIRFTDLSQPQKP